MEKRGKAVLKGPVPGWLTHRCRHLGTVTWMLSLYMSVQLLTVHESEYLHKVAGYLSVGAGVEFLMF
jgi:hypothetical protein